MITWTYSFPLDRPAWVKACTEFRDAALLLVRQSGKQEIRPGETLALDEDGEVIHLVATERRPG
jgi:hypothetical protein